MLYITTDSAPSIFVTACSYLNVHRPQTTLHQSTRYIRHDADTQCWYVILESINVVHVILT
jgi:hypothetical protein